MTSPRRSSFFPFSPSFRRKPESSFIPLFAVIPAQAGIQFLSKALDPGLRRDDKSSSIQFLSLFAVIPAQATEGSAEPGIQFLSKVLDPGLRRDDESSSIQFLSLFAVISA